VEGLDEPFDGHGICAKNEQRWVRTLGESLDMQHDPKGTLHPNETGHRQLAKRIRPVFTDALASD